MKFEPYTLSVKEVYGMDNPPIPNGKVGVAFRPAMVGETFLSSFLDAMVATVNDTAPRIILQDKPKRRVLVYEFDIVPDSKFKYSHDEVKESMVATHIA